MPRSSPYAIVLSEDERKHLETTARRYTAPYAEVIRAKLIRLAAEELENEVIGQKLDMPRQVVSNWRKRSYLNRFEGLANKPRSGAPLIFPPQLVVEGKGPRV